MSPIQTITALYNGKIAERIWTGSRHIWLIDQEPCTRGINYLKKRGLVWEHYPHNAGSAGLNERGKAVFEQTVMVRRPLNAAYNWK